MLLAGFWYVVGIAYVALGYANWRFATLMRVTQGQTVLLTQMKDATNASHSDENIKNILHIFEDLSVGLKNVLDLRVLYVAAASFFLAAGISFVQGYLIYAA
jgi:hypothetical protein